MSEKFPIPGAALVPAREEWAKPDTPGMFDQAYDIRKSAATAHSARPAYRFYYPGEKATDLSELSAFIYKEVLACAEAGVFREFAKVTPRCVSINELAVYAYDDFCRDVSEAWRRYQAKLDRIQDPPIAHKDDEGRRRLSPS